VKATMVRGIYICGRIVMCREAGRLDFALIHQQTSDRHWAIGDRLGAMILEGRGRASVSLGAPHTRHRRPTRRRPCPPASGGARKAPVGVSRSVVISAKVS
jgi:hypothetical protein